MSLQRRSRSLREWAAANGLGYTLARELAARPFDPIPHLRIGRRIHVDVVRAEEWIVREAARGDVDVAKLVNELTAALTKSTGGAS